MGITLKDLRKWIDIIDAFTLFKAMAFHADAKGMIQMSEQERDCWWSDLLLSNPAFGDKDLALLAWMAQQHLPVDQRENFLQVAREVGRLHDLWTLVTRAKGNA